MPNKYFNKKIIHHIALSKQFLFYQIGEVFKEIPKI